jgi:hypothetical protein
MHEIAHKHLGSERRALEERYSLFSKRAQTRVENFPHACDTISSSRPFLKLVLAKFKHATELEAFGSEDQTGG